MARRLEPQLRKQHTARQRRQGRARRHTAAPAALRRWRWTGCCGAAARRSGKRRRRTTAPSPSTTECELLTLLHTANLKIPADVGQYWKARRSVVWRRRTTAERQREHSTLDMLSASLTSTLIYCRLRLVSQQAGGGNILSPWWGVVRSTDSEPRLSAAGTDNGRLCLHWRP